MRLERDSGREIIDINGSRLSTAPFAALISAVKHLEPTYELGELDILTDRNSLRKLLRWVTGTADKDFRIDLQLAGEKTVIFSRWEEKAVVDWFQHHGYGHNFEAAYAKWPGGPKLIGHHRIVEYVSPILCSAWILLSKFW